MYLEMEKKEHGGREECSKCKIRALILHSEGIFVFSLHPAPLGHFRLEAAKKKVCMLQQEKHFVCACVFSVSLANVWFIFLTANTKTGSWKFLF